MKNTTKCEISIFHEERKKPRFEISLVTNYNEISIIYFNF